MRLTNPASCDLLARGIDIDSLECVVNFDVLGILKPTLTVLAVLAVWAKEGYVITLVTHQKKSKNLKKFASVRESVLKNQELCQIIPIALCTSDA